MRSAALKFREVFGGVVAGSDVGQLEEVLAPDYYCQVDSLQMPSSRSGSNAQGSPLGQRHPASLQQSALMAAPLCPWRPAHLSPAMNSGHVLAAGCGSTQRAYSAIECDQLSLFCCDIALCSAGGNWCVARLQPAHP